MKRTELPDRNKQICNLIEIGLTYGTAPERVYAYVAAVFKLKRRQVINIWKAHLVRKALYEKN